MPRRRHIAGREPIFAAVCVRSFSHGLEETLTAGPFPHLVRRTLCIASEEVCLGTRRRKRAAIWVEKRFEETKKPPPSLPTILPLRQFFCLFVWFTFPTFSQRSQKKKKEVHVGTDPRGAAHFGFVCKRLKKVRSSTGGAS